MMSDENLTITGEPLAVRWARQVLAHEDKEPTDLVRVATSVLAMVEHHKLLLAEWRAWMRDAHQDIEILNRVRDTLLKKLDDQRAEFSAKGAELKRLRNSVRLNRD